MPFAAAGIVAAYDLVRSLDGRAFRELAMGMALAGAAAVACNWPLPPAADTDVETTWIGVGTASSWMPMSPRARSTPFVVRWRFGSRPPRTTTWAWPTGPPETALKRGATSSLRSTWTPSFRAGTW